MSRKIHSQEKDWQFISWNGKWEFPAVGELPNSRMWLPAVQILQALAYCPNLHKFLSWCKDIISIRQEQFKVNENMPLEKSRKGERGA